MARARELLTQAASAASEADGNAKRAMAAELLESEWRRAGDPAVGARAVRVWAGVGPGKGHCAAQLRAATLELELGASLDEVATRLRTVRELPGCRDVAQRVIDAMPSQALELKQEARKSLIQPVVPAEGVNAVVTRVERYGSRDSARIVAFLSEPARFSVGALAAQGGRGPRVFVDIPRATYRGEKSLDVGGLVERVRLGVHEGGVRLALDLRESVRERIFYLPEPFRLVIDVSRGAGRNIGQVSQVRRVVLDPGHGGHDPGAIGPNGLQEKDVALDIAHRAAPLVARELGITTLLTRDGDEFVPLDERVAKANAFGADLFVSIHCNASESPDSHGVMTFVLDASRDAMAKRVAARENAASEEAAQQFASAMTQFMDAEMLSYSERLASLIQRASVASLGPLHAGLMDGGVRRAGFYVLAGAQMPAALFEVSFISNPTEEALLDTADYRQKLADSLVNAIRAYQAALD